MFEKARLRHNRLLHQRVKDGTNEVIRIRQEAINLGLQSISLRLHDYSQNGTTRKIMGNDMETGLMATPCIQLDHQITLYVLASLWVTNLGDHETCILEIDSTLCLKVQGLGRSSIQQYFAPHHIRRARS